MFIFTFNKELSYKILVNSINTELFEFVGRSQNERLDDLLFLVTSIISYGDMFSIEKLDLAPERKENIQRLLGAISGNSLFCNALSIRSSFIDCIRTMNMLSINR